jgi:hypothetical protein
VGSSADSGLEEPVSGYPQGARQDPVTGQNGAGDHRELQPQSVRLQDAEPRLLLRQDRLRQQDRAHHQRGGGAEVPREDHREGDREPAGRLYHLLRLLLQETALRAPLPDKRTSFLMARKFLASKPNLLNTKKQVFVNEYHDSNNFFIELQTQQTETTTFLSF